MFLIKKVGKYHNIFCQIMDLNGACVLDVNFIILHLSKWHIWKFSKCGALKLISKFWGVIVLVINLKVIF